MIGTVTVAEWQIAHEVFALRTDGPPRGAAEADPWPDFAASAQTEPSGTTDIVLSYGTLPKIDEGRCVFRSGTGWDVFRMPGQIAIRQRYSAGLQQGRLLTMPTDGGVCEILHSPALAEIHPLYHPFFHLLLVTLLGRGRGILLHAGAVREGDRVYLFPASSTGGKTTMTRLWRGQAEILNDERIVLSLQEDRLWAHGTPWHGELPHCSPAGAPLAGVFFLSHAAQSHLRPLRGVHAAAELLRHAMHPYWDETALAFAVDLCGRVAHEVPCFSLGFEPEPGVLDMVRCAV